MSGHGATALLPHTPWTCVRTVVNWLNGSTLLGLLLARLGGATPVRRGRGTWVAGGYRWNFPRAGAFTLGSVILSTREVDDLVGRERLLEHEDRHCTQYAWCFGPLMLVPYVLGVATSWVLAGDHSSYNPFERLAGLADGGYPEPTRRTGLRGRR